MVDYESETFLAANTANGREFGGPANVSRLPPPCTCGTAAGVPSTRGFSWLRVMGWGSGCHTISPPVQRPTNGEGAELCVKIKPRDLSHLPRLAVGRGMSALKCADAEGPCSHPQPNPVHKAFQSGTIRCIPQQLHGYLGVCAAPRSAA